MTEPVPSTEPDPFTDTRLRVPDRTYYAHQLNTWLAGDGIVIEGNYVRSAKRGSVHVRTGRELAAYLDGYMACKGTWTK